MFPKGAVVVGLLTYAPGGGTTQQLVSVSDIYIYIVVGIIYLLYYNLSSPDKNLFTGLAGKVLRLKKDYAKLE